MEQLLQTIDVNAIITCIISAFVIPILYKCGNMAVAFISTKIDDTQKSTENQIIKDLKVDLLKTVNKAVIATNQTFVDSLKEMNDFGPEKWAEAFTKTKTAIMDSLTEDMIHMLEKNVGNLDNYIDTLIQSAVNENKKPKKSAETLLEANPIEAKPTVVINTTSAEVIKSEE